MQKKNNVVSKTSIISVKSFLSYIIMSFPHDYLNLFNEVGYIYILFLSHIILYLLLDFVVHLWSFLPDKSL